MCGHVYWCVVSYQPAVLDALERMMSIERQTSGEFSCRWNGVEEEDVMMMMMYEIMCMNEWMYMCLSAWNQQNVFCWKEER